ncbi:MAG: RraA family protein [Ruminococcus sp.]|nr:RraA family protein [Ruminococcus sp.]
MNIKDKIIDYIKKNRVSTTEVADALGKTGAVEKVKPINKGHFKVGIIKWVFACDESNWTVHEQIKDIEESHIVFVDVFGCGGRAVFGELVSKYLLLYRQSEGIVVRGNMRDAASLLRQNWPIWCEGFNPVGCFNTKPIALPDKALLEQYREKYDGSIAVCDDCGVVIIPKENITESFLKALYRIESQEDIWFDRLDHYKENTFDIVCDKKYLSDKDYMRREKNEP